LNAKARTAGTILVVDDQAQLRTYVRGVLEEMGHEVLEAEGRDDAIAAFREAAPELFLVLLDLDFGGRKIGLGILEELRGIDDGVPVMLLTGEGSAADGAEAIRLGAAEVLEKDTSIERSLGVAVEKVRRMRSILDENRGLRARVELYEEAFRRRYELVGESPAFRGLIEEAHRVARVPRPILVRGERGTGKELVAAYIHYHSDRAEKPFVTVNCAAFHGNRTAGRSGVSSRRTGGRSSSTRSATWRRSSRRRSSASSSTSDSSGSPARRRSRPMSGSWRPPTPTWRR
jgi:two-component system nitrogen regulation response regulator NtrX